MKITTCVLLSLLTICFARPAEGKIQSSKFCMKTIGFLLYYHAPDNFILSKITKNSYEIDMKCFELNSIVLFSIVENGIIFYVHILGQIYYLEFPGKKKTENI